VTSKTCPICGARKGRRHCPVKSASICPTCCGAKRRVEIPCPDDCPYLTGEHAGSWDGTLVQRRRAHRRIVPFVQGLTEAQRNLCVLALTGISGIRDRRPDLDDDLFAAALGAFRKTAQTRSRGILFDHVPENLRALGLVHELEGLFEVKDAEGRTTAPSDDDLLAVVTALDTALDAARDELSGPTVFLDSVSRLVASWTRRKKPPTPSRIIIPGR
jgi:hypothetical protein